MSRNAEFHRSRTFQADIEPVTAAAAAAHHNTHGGSSFFVHGGERATSGYAVGGLKGVPETTIQSATITPEQWHSHREAVRRAVPDKDAVAGTWVEDGKTVMDASNVVADRDIAKGIQAARGERAVYNLGLGKEEDLR